MQKLTTIEITEGEETTVYEVGAMKFGAVMANPILKRAAGYGKSRPARSIVEDEETDLPAEDRPAVAALLEEDEADVASLIPTVICGTVRTINGEPVTMTEGDLNELSFPHVNALGQAIMEALGLKEGGRQVATFRVRTDGDAAPGAGV